MRMIRARAVAWFAIRRQIHKQQSGELDNGFQENGNKLFVITNDLIRRSEVVDFVIETYAGETPEATIAGVGEFKFLEGMISWIKENWLEIARIILMLFMILDIEPELDPVDQPGPKPG